MDIKKPRLLVLTDIGGDPDDEQTLIRLLTYANEFDIEGIIPEFWKSDEHKERMGIPKNQMKLVRKIVDAYGKVRDNLKKHKKGYPAADKLSSKIKRGKVNVPFTLDEEVGDVKNIIGKDKDTEGSEWIINLVDKDDLRPLNIVVWGGTADLAQALWKVRKNRDKEEIKDFISKIRVHAIDDQDITSPWIRNNFPDLFYIFNHARNGNKWNSCYRGMFLGGDESLTSKDWVLQNVKKDHGPLGKCYPLNTGTGDNPYGCLKEGDTPSWLYFLPVGLNKPEHPEWGSWGGRFNKIKEGNIYRDAIDEVNNVKNHRVTVWRWRPYFQNDFQARMDWCVESYKNANHNPVAVVEGDESKEILQKTVKTGERITIDASDSYDPDEDNIEYKWWIYREAGSYEGKIKIKGKRASKVTVEVPANGVNKNFHLILGVTDDGEPPLTAFRRLIFEIEN